MVIKVDIYLCPLNDRSSQSFKTFYPGDETKRTLDTNSLSSKTEAVMLVCIAWDLGMDRILKGRCCGDCLMCTSFVIPELLYLARGLGSHFCT